MGQELVTSHVLRRCKGVLPGCEGDRGPLWGRVSPRSGVGRSPARKGARIGPRGGFGRNWSLFDNFQPRAPQGRVRPRVDACDDCTPWFMVQDTPTPRVLRGRKGVLPRVRGGPWPPMGPRKPPKRRRTRPGAQGRADRAKGALWLERCASCKASRPRTRGPRPTSGGRQRRWFPLVYGARTSDVPRLETVQGRPPLREVGRGPARHGA